MIKEIDKDIASKIGEEIISEVYGVLPTIDSGGCVNETHVENASIKVINELTKIPTLNNDSLNYLIQIRDLIRENSIAPKP